MIVIALSCIVAAPVITAGDILGDLKCAAFMAMESDGQMNHVQMMGEHGMLEKSGDRPTEKQVAEARQACESHPDATVRSALKQMQRS